MALDRTRVYDALRAKLATAAEWAKVYDALPDETTVPVPSLVVLVDGQEPDYQGGRRPLWTCTANVIIYAQPGTGLPLIDAIEKALEASSDEEQPYKQFGPSGPSTNLGGLCVNLRMGGISIDFIRAGSTKNMDVLCVNITFTAV